MDSYLEELKAEAARVRGASPGRIRIMICGNFNFEAETLEANEAFAEVAQSHEHPSQ